MRLCLLAEATRRGPDRVLPYRRASRFRRPAPGIVKLPRRPELGDRRHRDRPRRHDVVNAGTSWRITAGIPAATRSARRRTRDVPPPRSSRRPPRELQQPGGCCRGVNLQREIAVGHHGARRFHLDARRYCTVCTAENTLAVRTSDIGIVSGFSIHTCKGDGAYRCRR